MNQPALKKTFESTGQFSSFDLHFAQFICDISKTENVHLFLAAALTTKAVRDGHVCCNLDTHTRRQIQTDSSESIELPTAEIWIQELLKHSAVGKPGAYCPLILDGTQLYLYRYWKYEQDLAQSLHLRAQKKYELDSGKHLQIIENLFSRNKEGDIDWQKVAAAVSMMNSISIISGGPGTGKTTTVAKILALLVMSSAKKLRIALAAPTGKAAARLSSAIQSILPSLGLPPEVNQLIPTEAQTIHRLLGAIPNSHNFRFNSENPLQYDIVLVDEASMIDLALMAKLVPAIPPESRLIMLGDRDQLSSVEAGAVLGDICDTGNLHCYSLKQTETLKKLIPEYNEAGNNNEPPITDCIVSLRKSYRFSESSGIGILSRAVNSGDIATVKKVLSSQYADCARRNLPTESTLRSALRNKVMEFFSQLSSSTDPEVCLSKLDSFKILCATRSGPYGVSSINNIVISILRSAGVIPQQDLYHGMPVMMSSNNYDIDLYNGDSGILLPAPHNKGELRAAFKGADSKVRLIVPRQLRNWDIAYSLTVHKSQGSEYSHVLLILPPVWNPVLTRELLYTAITRARQSIEIWCTEPILEKASESQTARQSGLRNKLWSSTRCLE